MQSRSHGGSGRILLHQSIKTLKDASLLPNSKKKRAEKKVTSAPPGERAIARTTKGPGRRLGPRNSRIGIDRDSHLSSYTLPTCCLGWVVAKGWGWVYNLGGR